MMGCDMFLGQLEGRVVSGDWTLQAKVATLDLGFLKDQILEAGYP